MYRDGTACRTCHKLDNQNSRDHMQNVRGFMFNIISVKLDSTFPLSIYRGAVSAFRAETTETSAILSLAGVHIWYMLHAYVCCLP